MKKYFTLVKTHFATTLREKDARKDCVSRLDRLLFTSNNPAEYVEFVVDTIIKTANEKNRGAALRKGRIPSSNAKFIFTIESKGCIAEIYTYEVDKEAYVEKGEGGFLQAPLVSRQTARKEDKK